MKLNKIIDKIKKFLKKDSLKESKEQKLLTLIEELKIKRTKIKKEIISLEKVEVKERLALQKKLDAVNKLLKKSRTLIDTKSKA